MKDLKIEKTQSTPYIYFDSAKNLLVIRGESFPENAAKFYAPVLDWLKEYTDTLVDQIVTMEFEIIYFNSSTSKIYMIIFDMMEERVKDGKNIRINWKCDKRNELAIECGEEFKEDLTELPFNIIMV